MKRPIRVVICSGTTCHVMGGADLLGLEEHLDEDLKGRVLIEGSPCLDLCKGGRYGKAPIATVDGRVVLEATLHLLLEEINRSAGRL